MDIPGVDIPHEQLVTVLVFLVNNLLISTLKVFKVKLSPEGWVKDFAIWRQAVSLWLSVRPGRGTSRSQEAQSQMRQLKRQLEEGRQYRDTPEAKETQPDYPEQPRLIEGMA